MLMNNRLAGSRFELTATAITAFCLCLMFALVSPVVAGEADVVGAKATETAPGVWRFDVTVRHADEGWDHYANRWDVIGPDGEELGVRVLAHPHETEQPFTRSLGGVNIPKGTPFVMIRANDSVHDLGGAEFKVPLQ